MSAEKIAILERQIDAYRCKGQWNVVKERAAKYRRKYFPTGSALESLALGDASLNVLLNQLQDPTPYDEAPHIDQLSPIYADKERAQEAVQHLETAVTRGLALARQKQREDAISALDNAVAAIESFQYAGASPPPMSKPPILGPDDDQWLKWVQQALFAHSMLALQLSQADAAHRSIQIYLKHLATTPATTYPKHKVAVLHAYLTSVLSSVPNPLNGIPPTTITTRLPLSVLTDVRAHLATYEKIVTTLLPFPRGEDVTEVEKGRYRRVERAYDWWVVAETCGGAEEPVGDQVERLYRLIETIYRGTRHTFHSMRLLRYLAHVFASLLTVFGDNMSSNEKTEAEATVETYLFFWDKHLTTTIELERKRRKEEILANADAPTTLQRIAPNGTFEQPRSPSPEEAPMKEFAKLALAVRRAASTPDIAVAEVEGEMVADAVGVLIAGVRICLCTVEGDEEKLRKAVRYAETAADILRDHGSTCKDLTSLSQKAYQFLGVAYGELGLEVRDSQERRQLQERAAECLRESVRLNESCWQAWYQLAMQYAELGEIADAIAAVNKSLQLKSNHIPSWNLLALLVSSRKELDQALKVCDMGWKECIGTVVRARQPTVIVPFAIVPEEGSRAPTPPELEGFTWDLVESGDKEDLMNLKLTQLTIETTKFGPKAGLETLQFLFVLYRKLFGNVGGSDEATKKAELGGLFPPNGDVRVNGVSEARAVPSAIRRLRGSTGSAASSSIPATPSSATLPALYRFRTYDLLISLWLAASSLYRELDQFDEARSSIEEAEKIADGLAKMDVRVKGAPGRVFRDHDVAAALQERARAGRGGKAGAAAAAKTKSGEEAVTAKWGPVDFGVRRVLADIAFEATLIRNAIYKFQRKPLPADKFMNYLSPAARLEAEHRLRRQQKSAIPLSPSNASLASTTTFLTSATVPIGRGTTPPPSHYSDRGSPAPGGGSTTSGSISGNPDNTLTVATAAFPDSASSAITLTTLIDDLFAVTLLDDDHLPSRVHLGILYHATGNLPLAEHWLERACKNSKARGGGGGKSGIGSCFGGATAVWGWECWRWLGRVMKETGRGVQAKECMYFAVGMERVCPVRGFECLRRVVD
ncbi:hypothetical protein HK104_001562 [Borealophlyctis nickersoniae]|nr:hypothetical protein HK104_001562 [Borealophlyctis nickersoniae]